MISLWVFLSYKELKMDNLSKYGTKIKATIDSLLLISLLKVNYSLFQKMENLLKNI